MTIFCPDISGWQAGIDLKGALAVGIKATEGTHYGVYDKVLAAYINDMVEGNGTAASKIPAGAKLWVHK